VRFNRGGKLLVPTGYVGVLQDDPIEKKPFFHALPGARALSFGMLGCDFHCGYCFTPKTRVATSKGTLPIGEIVSKKMDVEVYTHSGRRRKIEDFFSRLYRGSLFRIKPAFLPEIECTPEHPFLARLRPDRYPGDPLEYKEANKLTKDYCLAIPKHYEFSEEVVLKTRDHLGPFTSSYRVKRSIPVEVLERIMELSEKGKSSRLIAKEIGKSASHIRHLRSKVRSGKWDLRNLTSYKASLIEEAGRIRFSKEHDPGIPNAIPLSSEFAELLGFYCAEGSVTKTRDRVHSAKLNFSFGRNEKDKAERVKSLLEKLFGVKAYLVERETTLAAVTGKTSLALLFKALCGKRGSEKRVPEPLFRAKQEIVGNFLKAYVAGDGYRAPDGQIRISTISEELAWGIAWLVQKVGYLPQFYRYSNVPQRKLLGRLVKQSPYTYLVRWYETPRKQRHLWEDEDYRYILIEKIESFDYDGTVYNLETEVDHTYLAGSVAVHNCQNWVTSQALRDPVAGAPPVKVGPKELVEQAIGRGCQVLASTYNEPLITSEWAVDIFKEARKAGLVTAYISNGNGTPEVLDYIRPWVDLYKVDLKSFDDRHYRELGGVLDNVLATIRQLFERKFWLEIVTLLIPGFNDSSEEIGKLTQFLVSVSPDIPWHCTAFHKDYKMTDPENTSAATLIRAAEIGKKAGLRYIYAGNLPGRVEDWENTYCPGCRTQLIKRHGFAILENRLDSKGNCPHCGTRIPGFWRRPSS
jgi:pyruvate formate lyase activating enzyme